LWSGDHNGANVISSFFGGIILGAGGGKFPVVENGFPVLSPEIPCSIDHGIASKVPEASADSRIAAAATSRLS
jgi:hypothetical protein